MRTSLLVAALATAGLYAGAAHAETLRYDRMSLSSVFSFQYNARSMRVAAGQMSVRLDGNANKAYCVDLDNTIRGGIGYSVTPTNVAVDGSWCAISAILMLDDPSSRVESAARQAAIWMLTYPGEVHGFPANISTPAEALIDSVAGDCPLLCGEDIAWATDGAFDEAGLLHVEVTLTRADGSPIAFQDGWATASSGSFVGDGTFTTDADGRATVAVDATDATLPIDVSFATNGTRVVTLNGDPQNFQRLVTTLGACEYDPSVPFGYSEDGFGDPRTIGFWKHQTRAKGRVHVDADTLESYLPINVFGVTFNSVNAMNSALWIKKASMAQRAVQQCLATKLNVANGQLGWATPLDLGDGDAYLFTLWGAATDAFEAGDYETAKTICDDINNL